MQLPEPPERAVRGSGRRRGHRPTDAALAFLERAVDALPVRLFFLVVSPSQSPAEHLQVLAAISRWVRAPDRIEKVLRQEYPKRLA
jgi:mannitol/fructose-specific phosphotransferase system IIA component (Ntr-type)